MPTISTSWTTGIPSNTRVIFALPATSSGVPPTPETFVSVGLMGDWQCWGILWNAALDITVTAAPVSIRKVNDVPSTWPCVKIPFSEDPGCCLQKFSSGLSSFSSLCPKKNELSSWLSVTEVDYSSGLGSIPELELELMPIPIPIPGIGIAKELNKRNWNWNW